MAMHEAEFVCDVVVLHVADFDRGCGGICLRLRLCI